MPFFLLCIRNILGFIFKNLVFVFLANGMIYASPGQRHLTVPVVILVLGTQSTNDVLHDFRDNHERLR
jgi:hypothetical protein